MPWIDDVVTHTTIRSVWGNSVRDRTVLQWDSAADRAANNHPTNGQLSVLLDELSLWLWTAGQGYVEISGPWRQYTPQALWGGTSVPITVNWAQYRQHNRFAREVRTKITYAANFNPPSYLSVGLPSPVAAAPGSAAIGVGYFFDIVGGVHHGGIARPNPSSYVELIEIGQGAAAVTGDAWTGSTFEFNLMYTPQ